MELRAMKKLFAVAFLALVGLGLGGSKASAWWYLSDCCCNKHCPKIKCYQYNAFSPYCCYIPPGCYANRVLPNAPGCCEEEYPGAHHGLWNHSGCCGGGIAGSHASHGGIAGLNLAPGETIVSVTPGPTTPAPTGQAPAAQAQNGPALPTPAPAPAAAPRPPAPIPGGIAQGGPAYGQPAPGYGQIPPGYGQRPAYPGYQGGYPQYPQYGGYPQYPQYGGYPQYPQYMGGAAPGYWGNNGYSGPR
jgi:hypothetical protein